jgi:hypothetical protein
MQLPYGKLATSRRGPADLKEVNEAIAKDGMNGYLRVSVFDKSAVSECVAVYLAGRLVMAFASDGSADRKDPDYRQINEAICKENAIIEVCQLPDKQVKLLQDVYREFRIAVQAPAPAAVPAAPAKPAPREPPRVAAPTPGQEEKVRPMPMPEIRGRFVRAEEIADLDEYVQRHPGETGHLLFMVQANGRLEEQHIILIKGKIETAYNERASGLELVEILKGVSGLAEFYSVDEAVLTAIVGRRGRSPAPSAAGKQPERLAPERQPQAERPAGIGIPAREVLESSRRMDDIGRAVGEISGFMEDDMAMMRKVEREFASHVDELLSKLELSHLRSRKKK